MELLDLTVSGLPMNQYSDEKIIDAWQKNALQWSAAVRGGHIESRKLVTNKAIVDAVLRHAPESVLDIGCGEGWLIRELASQTTYSVGVDVVPDLIAQAKNAGGGHFRIASYEDIAAAGLGLFDVVVCNFSLFGKESVQTLFGAVPTLLKPGGVFIVQTLHPMVAGDLPYIDGWRAGSWAGIGSGFADPAPWYFRTLESWVTLFSDNGLLLLSMHEPIHPKTQKPASVLFTAFNNPVHSISL